MTQMVDSPAAELNSEVEPESAPTPSTSRRDLLVIGLLVILGIAAPLAPTAVRLPIGLAAALFAPGYALMAALLANEPDLDRADRIGLGLGASLMLIAVEAFVLDRSPWHLTADAIRVTSTGLSLVLLTVAAVRRRPRIDVALAAPAPPRRGPTRALRFTQAIVVTNLIVATIAYAVTVGGQPAPPTEFYVLGSEGGIGGYPREARVGEPMVVRVGINEPAASTGRYQVVAKAGDRVLATLNPGAVATGTRSESELRFQLDTPGPSQEVDILLQKDGSDTPTRSLRLWVDVTPVTPR